MSIISKTIEQRWDDLSTQAQRRAIASGRIDPRKYWDLYEDGECYATVTAEDRADALQQAVDNARNLNISSFPRRVRFVIPRCSRLDRDNYDAEGTIWIDVSVRNTLTGESDSETVQLDEPEPECVEDAHDWRSPYSVLGGMKENPGVWGNGGGVISKTVCAHCGMYRITNTWAQRHDTGEEGLTDVTYEPADDESEAWVASL